MKYLDLTRDYVDRNVKMKDLEARPIDPNISNADLMANVFILVVLVASIIMLMVE